MLTYAVTVLAILWMRVLCTPSTFSFARAQVFGIDLYSLFTSAEEVVRFLDLYDPELCAFASERYNRLYRVAAAADSAGAGTSPDVGTSNPQGLGVQQEAGGLGVRWLPLRLKTATCVCEHLISLI